MKKACLIGNANLLNVKIQNTLINNGFRMVDIYRNLSNINVKLHNWDEVECVVIDLDNGETDMIEFIKEMKKQENAQKIPIISLSSNAEFKTLKRAIAVGCSEFLVKPFDMSVLVARVYKLCKQEKTFIMPESTDGTKQNEDIHTLKWIRDFEIGVQQIDEEHKEIIISFNKLYELMKMGKGHEYYEELLAFLKKYVGTHFAHEEKLLLDNNYPGLSEHKKLHNQFSTQILEMEKTHSSGLATDKELILISLYVRDWLYQHILIEDNKIGDYINKKAI